MPGDQDHDVDWNDWMSATEIEATEGDWSDAKPLCARCLNEVSTLDHYCGRCQFAVGQLTPNIPFVNIPFLFEPFAIMWEWVRKPREESVGRRVLYATLLLVAGAVTVGLPLIMVVLLLTWLLPARGPGKCRKCGYDLRASVDRCPECGSAIDAGSAPHSAPSP